MPSKDRIDPKANEWMVAEGIDTKAPVAKPKKRERVMAGQVLRIARRLGKKPEEMAEEIPADTMRRLNYPVLESRNPDGTRSFTHDLGIKTDGHIHT